MEYSENNGDNLDVFTAEQDISLLDSLSEELGTGFEGTEIELPQSYLKIVTGQSACVQENPEEYHAGDWVVSCNGIQKPLGNIIEFCPIAYYNFHTGWDEKAGEYGRRIAVIPYEQQATEFLKLKLETSPDHPKEKISPEGHKYRLTHLFYGFVKGYSEPVIFIAEGAKYWPGTNLFLAMQRATIVDKAGNEKNVPLYLQCWEIGSCTDKTTGANPKIFTSFGQRGRPNAKFLGLVPRVNWEKMKNAREKVMERGLEQFNLVHVEQPAIEWEG